MTCPVPKAFLTMMFLSNPVMLNRAIIGRHDAVSAMSQISPDYLPISDSHRVLGLVAIPPWLAHANHRMDHDVIQLAYSLKRIHYAPAFHIKLRTVVHLLA